MFEIKRANLHDVRKQITTALNTVVSDIPFDDSWDGVTNIAPSKNAVYDKITAMDAAIGGGAVLYTNEIADDTAWSYDIGRPIPAGDVAIVSNNGSHRGIYGFRTAATSFLSGLGTATGITATTGILSGTTGADATVTASVHTDNKLYIENRSGGILRFHVNLAMAAIEIAFIEFSDGSLVQFSDNSDAEFA